MQRSIFKLTTCCLAILMIACLNETSTAQPFAKDTLKYQGPDSNRINLVYLSDGYLSGQFMRFRQSALAINQSLFNTSPFSEYKLFFNSFCLLVPSIDSGTIHPATANDETYSGSVPVQPITNPNNYFKSQFDYGGIHRLLVAADYSEVYNVLMNNFPTYDQAFIVANTPFYGGSGGAFATTSVHTSASEIAIHEIGHSFAKLADEYWAGSGYAAEKPNMTANNNTASIKWRNWLWTNNIGINPYGASGDQALWFKPATNCKMQALGNPFCSVCSEAIIDRIHQMVNMIDGYSPSNTSLTLATGDSVSFSVNALSTTSNTIRLKWYLNDTLIASNVAQLMLNDTLFRMGLNTVRAEAVDNTILSRSQLATNGYVDAITWSVTKSGLLPVSLVSFAGKLSGNDALLSWKFGDLSSLAACELQRSADGRNFSGIANIPAQQNVINYVYNDVRLAAPINYYRLKMMNRDGTYTFSSVVRLQLAANQYVYKIIPQGTDNSYMLKVNCSKTDNVSMQVIDAAGKTLIKKDFGNGSEQLSYNFALAKRAAGMYFLKLIINRSTYTSQLIAN